MIETENLPSEVENALNDLTAHYQDFEAINRGANGYLFFAKNKVSKMDVAIKFYAGEPGENRHDEPRQLSALTCPNVLPILEARSISDEWAFFMTPRCFEGDIDDIIGSNPSVHKALDIAVGICAGVSSIHAAGMIHRDLKPGNIVILDGTPRIADFGSVTAIEEGQQDVGASRHSILWRPPESFETERYSIKGDVYQVGIAVYQLLGGKLHYDGMEYLSKKQRKYFEAITDAVDQSIFVDEVIKDKALKGKLVDIKTLPGWLDSRTRRTIKIMCHHDIDTRPDSVADVAAMLTTIRSRVANWKWKGTTALLERDGSIIEFRSTNNADEYIAHKDRGTGFRRIPKFGVGSLSQLASKL
ncbi:MAG: protein kinase [Deltaproteobacteria bacterium]|nr:protein kinase [Deltaproteobacteria bacterium]